MTNDFTPLAPQDPRAKWAVIENEGMVASINRFENKPEAMRFVQYLYKTQNKHTTLEDFLSEIEIFNIRRVKMLTPKVSFAF